MPRSHPQVSFEGIGARGLQSLALPSSVEGERPRFAGVTRVTCGTAVCAALEIICVVWLLTSCCFILSSFLASLLFCSLYNCKLGPDGGMALAKALETNSSLKSLK